MSSNLKRAAASLDDYWSPRILGQVNDQYLKVARLKGTFTWHRHDDEDELFLVLSGQLRIEYEDHSVTLNEGDFHIVPKGVMHNPVCEEECLVALIETVTTRHTGAKVTEQTRTIDEQLNR